MKIFFISILCFILSGCYSKCGFTDRYYCNCEEWYDADGGYQKKCPEKLISVDFKAKIDLDGQ